MSASVTTCLVCLGIDPGTSCTRTSEATFRCDVCGTYTIADDLAAGLLAGAAQLDVGDWDLTKVQRAVLSHRVRTKHDREVGNDAPVWFRISKNVLDDLRSDAVLPTVVQQGDNAIRFVGDYLVSSGESVLKRLPDYFRSTIGAPDYEGGLDALEQLEGAGYVKIGFRDSDLIPKDGEKLYKRLLRRIGMTRAGWEHYERVKERNARREVTSVHDDNQDVCKERSKEKSIRRARLSKLAWGGGTFVAVGAGGGFLVANTWSRDWNWEAVLAWAIVCVTGSAWLGIVVARRVSKETEAMGSSGSTGRLGRLANWCLGIPTGLGVGWIIKVLLG